MASLEDKILGEKLHNYCSSSEESDNEGSGDEKRTKGAAVAETQQLPEPNKWEGSSTNTGPKGVIQDWHKFKQQQHEKRLEQQKELADLAKKFTMTVRTALDDEDDPELAELLDDEFLAAYQKKRMDEMREAMTKQNSSNKKFGELIMIKSREEFLHAIDNEDKKVTVIVHVYENHIEACRTMHQCLKQLAKTYDTVKFTAITASQVGVSQEFKNGGLPALLLYKAENLIGSLLKVTDQLGSTFQVEDVQNLLVEHWYLEDKNLNNLVKSSAADESDSD